MIRLHTLLRTVTECPDRRAARSTRPAAFRPTLETLEARETPTSLAHAQDSSMLLFLSGGGKGAGEVIVLVGHGHQVINFPGN